MKDSARPQPPDALDRQLMRALVGNGRLTLAALGDLVGLTAPAVHERLHKLESSGVIRGFTAVVDPESVGSATLALVFLRLSGDSDSRRRLESRLGSNSAVLELHEVAGDDCYVAKVRVGSTRDLADFLATLREEHPSLSTRSSVVLRSCFERLLMSPVEASPSAPGE